jgi:cubilin
MHVSRVPQIRNGETSDSTLIGRYCGSSIPAPIHSSAHSLWIKFKSDSSVQNHGFRARYETANTGSGAGAVETTNGKYLHPFLGVCGLQILSILRHLTPLFAINA